MLLIKVTLVLACAVLASAAMRRRPAATRHRVWSWTFAAVLALPLLMAALPALDLQIPDALARVAPAPAAARVATPIVIRDDSTPLGTAVAESQPSPAIGIVASPARQWNALQLLGTLWLAGTLVALGALALSLLRVRRLAARSHLVEDGCWTDTASEASRRLGIRGRVRLLTSTLVTTPMAGGLWRPAIFLPAAAAGWDAEHRDVVLAHELAHLAARDHWRHLLARLALALYWFHPLAWIAARQAAAAREAACDERVLALGTRPSTYARILVDLASSVQRPPRALAALPMVHRSMLEARVMAILNGTLRPFSPRRGAAPATAIVIATLLVAAASPGAVRPDDTRWVGTAPAGAPDATAAAPAAPPVVPAANTMALAAAAPQAGRDDGCQALARGRTFAGNRSTTGRSVVVEQIGTLDNAHRIVLFTIDGALLCMFGEAVGPRDAAEPPSRWIGRAKRIVMESTTGSTTHRLVIDGAETRWTVNGTARAIDRAANEWRERMLAVLDARWEATMLRGEQTSLRGEITSIRGEETSLRGQITSLRGEVTSMRGRITAIRGEDVSMRGRITSIRGHETSLRGQITSARGAITAIRGGGYPSADADRRIAEYEREIERLEQEIRDYNADAKVAEIEKEIERYDADRKVAEIEKEIDAFDLDRRVAEVERRIAALEVPGKVAGIEDEVRRLDAERRAAEIEKRAGQAAAQLKATIAAIR